MKVITLLILAYCLNPVFIQSSQRPITVSPQERDLTAIIIHSDQLPFSVTISSTWVKLTPNSMQLDRYFLYQNTLTAEFSISQLETTQNDPILTHLAYFIKSSLSLVRGPGDLGPFLGP